MLRDDLVWVRLAEIVDLLEFLAEFGSERDFSGEVEDNKFVGVLFVLDWERWREENGAVTIPSGKAADGCGDKLS